MMSRGISKSGLGHRVYKSHPYSKLVIKCGSRAKGQVSAIVLSYYKSLLDLFCKSTSCGVIHYTVLPLYCILHSLHALFLSDSLVLGGRGREVCSEKQCSFQACNRCTHCKLVVCELVYSVEVLYARYYVIEIKMLYSHTH